MRKQWSAFLVILLALTFIVSCAGTTSVAPNPDFKAELVTLNTRPGVTQKMVILTPEKPVASVILFNGGFGKIEANGKADSPKIGISKNFLVRTREQFASQGFVTAVVDVPSDQIKNGIDPAFRISDEHMKDVKATIDFMKTKNLPVFLAGQSLGTISVAMAGINYNSSLDGIIMTSNATKPRDRWFTKWPVYKNYPNAILDFELDKITVPALVVAHAEDSCEPTPPDRAKTLQEKLVNSPHTELKIYTGGQAKEMGCNFWGHHSYYGQEEQVVNDISAFIKANL